MKLHYIFCIALISGVQVIADPPKDIKAYKVRGAHTIHLSIIHKVKNPETHFIDFVRVTYNDILVFESTFDKQNHRSSLEIEIPNSVAISREVIEDEILGDEDQGDTAIIEQDAIISQRIPIAVNSRIQVTATCNKRGDMTKMVLVQETP